MLSQILSAEARERRKFKSEFAVEAYIKTIICGPLVYNHTFICLSSFSFT
jgi:hypothetical protein